MMRKMRTYEPPSQKIQLERIEKKGLVVDIGGGGEGLVSRLEGARVCAVDIRMDEIREARIHNPPSNWFACDGSQLCFHSSTFDIATFWFSLGYMKGWKLKADVLGEAYRVLGHGGVILIKAARVDCKEERYVFKVDYTLPDGSLSRTGYGLKGQQNQTMKTVAELVQDVGFQVVACHDYGHWFSIEGSKSLKSGLIVERIPQGLGRLS